MSNLPPEQKTKAKIDVTTIDIATLGTLILFLDEDIALKEGLANKAGIVKIEKIATSDSLYNKAKIVIEEANALLDNIVQKVVSLW